MSILWVPSVYCSVPSVPLWLALLLRLLRRSIVHLWRECARIGVLGRELFQHDEGQSIGYPYFKERGFNDVTIKAFELGYSLENWDAFTKDAIAKGYSLEVLEKAGLTIRKAQEGGKEDRLYDRFRGRVIFPIHNLSGNN